MSLTPGTRLGVYQITALLGEGGMGQVFLARDTKLDRDVAIKVLPEAFAHDVDRLARFTREAKTLASLNHPNIAAIYGLEESDGITALVMELVEGEDLSQRIARGAIPLDEALPIAKQIAEALEAAHEQGIVHRDLKPANVKVRADGTVKVLDFGLAKALDPPAASSPEAMNSPTITSPAMTRVGMILGTAAYMSPEQARAKTVDRRADIWAFGVVLFEMLTGRRAFSGDDISITMAAVLMQEPDWSAVPAATPAVLRRLLTRCLKKDPKARLQSMGDARVQIEELLSGAPNEAESGAMSATTVVQSPARAARSRWTRALPWALAVSTTVLAIAWLSMWTPWRADTAADRPLIRLDVDLGPDVSLPPTVAGGSSVIVSPDGTRLVYVSGTPTKLFTRRLDQPKATELPGTERATYPFFSPDGQWIGFFSSGTVRKVSVEGGAVVPLLGDITLFGNGSWAEDGSIIASDAVARGLLRIPPDGGPPETIAPRGDGDFALVLPTILPGGKAILFVSAYATDVARDTIEVLTLADRGRKTVARGHSPRYLAESSGAGYLVYNNRTTLFAIPFDLETLETRGTAVPVLDDVANDSSTGSAHFSVTSTGTLVYRRAGVVASADTTLQWIDPAGKREPLLAKPGGYQDLRLSPDGARVALTVQDSGGRDVWVYDLQRDGMTRLTFGGGTYGSPTWNPDGHYVVFSRVPGGLFQAHADGASPPKALTQANTTQIASSFTPDGKRLAYFEFAPRAQLWTLPLADQGGHLNAGTPEPFLKSSFRDSTPAFSPDGRWLAYSSSESGTNEVYVRAFPPPSSGEGGKWQISNSGGLQPRWSRNGRELLYRSGDQIMAVGYTATGGTLVAEKPRVWIQALGVPEGAAWDLAPDGKRVLVVTPVESAEAPKADHHVVFLQNFLDELRRRVPLDK